jgi:DNA-directed RNA polymerase subunit RPC12/RpoP
MTEIEIKCPDCGQHIKYDADYRGEINCPTCKQLLFLRTTPQRKRTFIARLRSPQKGEQFTISDLFKILLLLFAVPLLVLFSLDCWDLVVVQGKGHQAANKQGSVAYLDFKNGIGGISLGSSVASFEQLGFAPSGANSGGQIYYTNDAYEIEFADYYLTNTLLVFISEKLVAINGDVESSKQTKEDGGGRLYKLLTVLFGEPTEKYPVNRFHATQREDGSVSINPYPTADGCVDRWVGKKVEMKLYGDRLYIRDYHTIEAQEKEEQAQKEKGEKAKDEEETLRMKKQDF